MYSRFHKTHRVRIHGLIQDVFNCSTFDAMLSAFGENYVGEVCNVTGRIIRTNLSPKLIELVREESFDLKHTPNQTNPKGVTMYDPLFEQIFGESNLAGILTPKEYQSLQSLLSQVVPTTDDILLQYAKDAIPLGDDNAVSGQRCTQKDCAFCAPKTVNRERVQFEPASSETYQQAAKGERPWPLHSVAINGSISDIPAIKGVVLKDSNSGQSITLDTMMKINNSILVNYLTSIAPTNKRFAITRDPDVILETLLKYVADTTDAANDVIKASRSPVIQQAIFDESVESLKRRTYIAFGDLMSVNRLSYEYVVDNAEANVFNLSVKDGNRTQRICTIRYSNLQYTIEVFR